MNLNYLGNCALQENVIIIIIIISSSSSSSSSSSILGMKQLVEQEEYVDRKLQAYAYGSEANWRLIDLHGASCVKCPN